MDKHGALRLFALDPPAGPPPSSCWSRPPRAGTSRAEDRPRRRRRPAVAPRRGPPDRRPAADRARRRPPRGRHGRARARHLLAAPARGGAGGAGPADLRRRRPRLLVPGAGARRPRVAARARQPARRGGAAHRPLLALPRRGHRRAGPAHRAGRARQPLGRASRPPTPRSRSCSQTEREHAQRAPLEVLLERAIVATGYDLAMLARPGGDRRLANLRKLMRLAGEYERAEGRDLRGFLADAQQRDLAEAREGEAALESEGLDAVRLMTIHRAKGLEFPVVCRRRPRPQGGRLAARRCWSEPDGTPGLRLAPLGGGDTIPTPAWERLAAAEIEAEAEEERRLFYVAMTRARELLILSGGTDVNQVARRRAPAARRSTGSPARSPALALHGGRAADHAPPATAARPASSRSSARPTRTDDAARRPALKGRPRAPRRRAATTALPAKPAFVPPRPLRARPVRAAPLLLAAHRLRAVRLPLLPPARPRAARRRPTST